ncbi:MAG: hypothetical protein EBX41_11020 [Chitinophagia bacterium]|nr:hypothetical protein [Chitinophagia bacterium]
MSIHYLSNDAGEPIAVQISISDWVMLKNKYPDLDADNTGILTNEQKQWIDSRLDNITQNPDKLNSIEGLLHELDKD